MYTLCVTEKTARQQREFEAAFLEYAREVPYDDITISELCRRAGLSRKTFYRLFERKSDVLDALLDHTILDASFYEPDETVGEGGLHRFLGFWRTQEALLDVLQKNKISAVLTDRVVEHMLQEGGEYTHCLGLDETQYGTEALRFYVSGIFSLVLNWHQEGFDKSIDALSDALMYLMMTPPVKHPLMSDPANWVTKR